MTRLPDAVGDWLNADLFSDLASFRAKNEKVLRLYSGVFDECQRAVKMENVFDMRIDRDAAQYLVLVWAKFHERVQKAVAVHDGPSRMAAASACRDVAVDARTGFHKRICRPADDSRFPNDIIDFVQQGIEWLEKQHSH